MNRDREVMPKSQSRRRRASKTRSAGSARGQTRGRGLWRPVAVAAGVVLAATAAWFWYANLQSEQAFLEHARLGKDALTRVVRPPNEGRGDVSPGQVVRYQGDPPTSGLHDRKWIDSGVYERIQNRMKLVHSLEHGTIVVYYDTADPATWEVLNDWADLYDYPRGGIVLAPKPGLREAIVLTAWTRLLHLEPFDADAAAAFIDTYRGRGPESRIR